MALVIEYAVHNFGDSYKGRMPGNLTTIACTSIPQQTVGCYGEGGALFTNEDELLKVARRGHDRRYHHIRVVINRRFDILRAGIDTTPYIESYNISVRPQYTLQVPNRQAMQEPL